MAPYHFFALASALPFALGAMFAKRVSDHGLPVIYVTLSTSLLVFGTLVGNREMKLPWRLMMGRLAGILVLALAAVIVVLY